MKKILASIFFLLPSSFLAAKAELLYFMADADDWDKPETFDFAMIGVSKYDEGAGTWSTTWGADGSQMYLHLYDTMEATLGNSAAVTKSVVAENFADYTRGSDIDDKTAVGWADVSDYTGDGYRFYIEVYLKGEGTSFLDESETYGQLLSENHIYRPGVTDAQPVTPWTVPEPSGGLLLLFGLAGLALKRRRPAVKKLLVRSVVSLFVFHLSLFTCRAAADDALISFSTKGPDTYLDGTTVRDGECYALVWTRSGASFGGLAADGTAVGTNSRVLVFAPIAKGGRCPPVLFELDAALAKSLADGAYSIYLLDTRLASGAVGGVNAKGVPVAVNGYGSVDAFVPNASDKGGSSGGDAVETTASTRTGARIAVTTRSALPANAPKPTITAIRLVGDNVYLTVKGTLPCLKYKAVDAFVSNASDKEDSSGGDAVGTTASTGGSCAAGAAQGAASTEDEITVIAPKRGARGFYSVQRD